MVGDRSSDVEAGRAAGCATVFIDLGYGEPAPDAPDYVVHSIAEAADVIIETALTAQEATMSRITDLKVKIFADGADYDGIVKMAKNPVIKGFTTNPTLMRKAGVNDYEAFARKVLAAIPDRPVSFEVFADDFASMAEQARAIAAWGTERERENSGHQHQGAVRRRVARARCRPRASCST